uniref:Uncharacterized protein n=1 Tax=Psilocybe cubensis TaxID=181762 RepID=A0A8H8CK89_PSICU
MSIALPSTPASVGSKHTQEPAMPEAENQLPNEDQYKPKHVLSKVSKTLGKDTFFWAPTSHRLIGGLNHNVTPITSKILHTWASLLDTSNDRRVKFEIYPVKITSVPIGLFYYERYRSGENIPEMSTEPLPPGDYDFQVFANKKIDPIAPTSNILSFKQIKYQSTLPKEKSWLLRPVAPEMMYMVGFYIHTIEVPDDIQKEVLERDNGRCLISGTAGDDAITVVWAVPPPLPFAMRYVDGGGVYKSTTELYKSDNAFTLLKDLADAFLDGAFGVDVDDDYRIVVLKNFGPAAQPLIGPNIQAYFHHPSLKAQFKIGPKDIFLRAHFVNCLYINFQGGDIVTQYPKHIVEEREKLLGFYPGESPPLRGGSLPRRSTTNLPIDSPSPWLPSSACACVSEGPLVPPLDPTPSPGCLAQRLQRLL